MSKGMRALPAAYAFGAAALVAAGAASAGSTNFDTAGDFGSANFAFSASPAWYVQTLESPAGSANGPGVAGSGGLSLIATGGGDVSANYIGNDSIFDFAPLGSVVETSIFFRKAASLQLANTNRLLDLGITPAANAFLNLGNGHAGVRFRAVAGQPDGVDLRFRNNNADVGSAVTGTLTADTYYKLTFRLTNVDGTALNFQSWVDDYGPSGLALVSAAPVISLAGSYANATLGADSSVYGAIRMRNENNVRAVPALDNFAITGASGSGTAPGRTFRHPGLLNDQREMAQFAQHAMAGQGLWGAGWDRLRLGADFQNLPLTSHQPQAVADYGASPHWSAPGTPRDLIDDARAAYANALIWRVTHQPDHAARARTIINAWSTTLTTIYNNSGQPMTANDARQDYMLYTSYSWPAMIWAAEVLRSDPASGWNATDTAAFSSLLTNVVRPAAEHPANSLSNNWASWRICYKTADAIFTEDSARFAQVQQEARSQITGYLGPNLHGEMGRDLWHSQMGLAPLVATAEMALKQGVDLYSHNDNQLLRAIEYQIPFFLGDFTNWPAELGTPDPEAQFDQSTVWPFFEMAYNHYHNRLGLSTPNLEIMLNHPSVKQIPNWPYGTQYNTTDGRPYRAEDFHRIGYGTLTHVGTPVRWQILAGFDTAQTLAQQGLAATGSAQVVTDPTAGQGANGVLMLQAHGDEAPSVGRLVVLDEQFDLWFDWRFSSDGTLAIVLDGQVIDSWTAPIDGLGRHFFDQYRASFTLASLGLSPGDYSFALELRGSGTRGLWLDNLILTTIPEPPAFAAVLAASSVLLRRRNRRAHEATRSDAQPSSPA